MKFIPLFLLGLIAAVSAATAQGQDADAPKTKAEAETAAEAATAPEIAAAPGALDRIVAVVDEDVILKSELDRAVANIHAQYRSNPGQLPPQRTLEKQVLERLVLLRLQMERARGGGIRISDAELEQAMQQVARSNNMTPEQLRGQLAADGIAYDEFRTELRNELLVQRLRQQILRSRVAVSDSEIDALLASSPEAGPEVHVAHIVVALPDGATPEQIELGRTKITGIKGLIDKGEMDFTAAAIRYSDSPNALEGGDLGWRNLNEVPPAFSQLLRGMQPGQVSDPIRGPTGFQLIQLVETREQGRQTITEYRASDILIRTSELVSPETARQKIDQTYARLQAGEDFAKVAGEVSEDTLTRNQGGDMGWFQQFAWGSAIGNLLPNMRDGEVSAPFQSDAGWHIVKREGVREQDVTAEARRNQARETIARRKSEEEFERFLRQVRDEAYVEMRLDS